MFDVIYSYFTEPWQLTILLCVACASLSAGVLGPIVVSSRMAFFTDAVAHSTLAGVALGMLLGVPSPVFSMIGFAVIIALLVASLRRYTTLGLDTVLGVAMAGSLAVGVLLFQKTSQPAGLHDYLFGSVALLGVQDLMLLAASTALALLMTGLNTNNLLLIAVSRPLAQARGVNVARHELMLIVVLALVVAVGVRAVGLLMVNALLIVPAAASRNISRSVGGMFRGSVAIALASGAAGLFVAPSLGFSEGPAIVAASVVLFIACQALRTFKRNQPSES